MNEPQLPTAAAAEMREQVARAMAKAAGSRAFHEPGTAWDHPRSAWYAHADAALSVRDRRMEQLAVEAAAYDQDALDAMNHNDQTCEAVAERDQLRDQLEQAEAASQEVREARTLADALYAVAKHDGLATDQPQP
ncbi:hypothetical protein [Streptomyces sp. H27-D2]|uniref:hypothetical protein n=1 Tax=Streptomyces sp. H27-D2 TaxID=3046304 RepID=UPI002DB81180|nr:hypothetical protein [Streptomyces sp. H27-D2]MEC4016042.1 hypothetical protein [Streptomyces sp. H27-D2]